jgi:GxxExxY protein
MNTDNMNKIIEQEGKSKFLFQKESELILKSAFNVYNELGNGFLEKVYENSLFIELKTNGFSVETQVPIPVYYKNNIVGKYFADIVVNDKIILEIKSCRTLEKIHESQLLHYLKATKFKVGYLLNFGYEKKLQYKRFIL